MTLVRTRDGSYDNRLTECPACGIEFEKDERPCLHIQEHSPSDFGLTPLGYTETPLK